MLNCNPAEQCAHCRGTIASGERWVRVKIYEPTLVGQDARYRRYHADLFDGEEVSCWEKHQIAVIAQTTARAA
jgi:hypothetical protein